MLTDLSEDWQSLEPFMLEDMWGPVELDCPPLKPGQAKPQSKEHSFQPDTKVEDQDQDLQLLNWIRDPFSSAECDCNDDLWFSSDEKLDEKLSPVLGCSPLLSDIDIDIFEDMVSAMLDYHNPMAGEPDQSQAPAQAQVASEVTSDYGSASGETSEEEVDVESLESEPDGRRLNPEDEQRAIQLQHNYAAPCPASPPAHKRSRGADGSSRLHHATRSSTSSSFSLSSSSSSSEEEEERRRTHNVMERQRRNELKNCFLRLRNKVPELSHNDKASKVVILKKARDCIYGLEAESLRLRARKDRLRAKQEELKARLERLRR